MIIRHRAIRHRARCCCAMAGTLSLVEMLLFSAFRNSPIFRSRHRPPLERERAVRGLLESVIMQAAELDTRVPSSLCAVLYALCVGCCVRLQGCSMVGAFQRSFSSRHSR